MEDNKITEGLVNEIIDQRLDDSYELDSPEMETLAKWVKEDPSNADNVFKRFLLHVMLKEHYGKSSFENVLNTGKLENKSSTFTTSNIIIYIVILLLVAILLTGTTMWNIYNNSANSDAYRSLSEIKHYIHKDYMPVTKYSHDQLYFKDLNMSVWADTFTAPKNSSSCFDKTFHLSRGCAWVELDQLCKVVMQDDSYMYPSNSGYIHIQHGSFYFNNSNSTKKLALETQNLILYPESSSLCIAYNDDYACTDIYILSGTAKLIAKDETYENCTLARDGLRAAHIDYDGLQPGVDSIYAKQFGQLISMTYSRCPVDDMEYMFTYDSFNYADQSISVTNEPKVRNGGWGWHNSWREYGGIDCKIADVDNQSSDNNKLIYKDSEGFLLRSFGGYLSTPSKSYSNSYRKINVNSAPPYLVENDAFGRDGTTVWISFLAQDLDDSLESKSSYLFLGEHRKGIMIGRSELIHSNKLGNNKY